MNINFSASRKLLLQEKLIEGKLSIWGNVTQQEILLVEEDDLT